MTPAAKYSPEVTPPLRYLPAEHRGGPTPDMHGIHFAMHLHFEFEDTPLEFLFIQSLDELAALRLRLVARLREQL